MNGPGKYKLDQGRNSWEWTKHAWLCTDLLLDLKGEHLSAVGSQQKDINFCHPLRDYCEENLPVRNQLHSSFNTKKKEEKKKRKKKRKPSICS